MDGYGATEPSLRDTTTTAPAAANPRGGGAKAGPGRRRIQSPSGSAQSDDGGAGDGPPSVASASVVDGVQGMGLDNMVAEDAEIAEAERQADLHARDERAANTGSQVAVAVAAAPIAARSSKSSHGGRRAGSGRPPGSTRPKGQGSSGLVSARGAQRKRGAAASDDSSTRTSHHQGGAVAAEESEERGQLDVIPEHPQGGAPHALVAGGALPAKKKGRGKGKGKEEDDDPNDPMVLPPPCDQRQLPSGLVIRLRTYPCDANHARFTGENIVSRLQQEQRATTPLAFFVPIDDKILTGKTLATFGCERAVNDDDERKEPETESHTSKAYKACCQFLYAQGLRGHATVIVSLRREAAVGDPTQLTPLGYYVFAYPSNKPWVDIVPGPGAGAAAPVVNDAFTGSKPHATTANISVQAWLEKRLWNSTRRGKGLKDLTELLLGPPDNPRNPDLGSQAQYWDGLFSFSSVENISNLRYTLFPRNEFSGSVGVPAPDQMDAAERLAFMQSEFHMQDIISYLFSPERAASLCVRARNARFGTVHRTAAQTATDVNAELDSMRYFAAAGLAYGPPLDRAEVESGERTGDHVFRVPRPACSFAVLSRFAMPHLTPPIDTNSSVYTGLWHELKGSHPEFISMDTGEERPSKAFFLYFKRTLGSTVATIGGEDFEAVLATTREIARKEISKLRIDNPRAAAALMRCMARNLGNEIFMDGTQRPEGLRHAVARFRLAAQTRGAGMRMLQGRMRLSNSHGSLASLQSLMMDTLYISFKVTHLHLYGLIAWTLGTGAAHEPPPIGDEPFQVPLVHFSGDPGSGKTYLLMKILKMMLHFVCKDYATQLMVTQTKNFRGDAEFNDEPAATMLGIPTLFHEMLSACHSGQRVVNAGRYDVQQNISASATTSGYITVQQLLMQDKLNNGMKKRVGDIVRNAVFKVLFLSYNYAPCLDDRMFRRGFVFCIPRARAGVPGCIEASSEPMSTQRLRDDSGRVATDAFVDIHAFMTLILCMHASGAYPFSIEHGMDAFSRAVSALYPVVGPVAQSIGPHTKRCQFSTTLVTQKVVTNMMNGIGTRDPLLQPDPVQMVVDANFHAWEDTNITALSMDLVLGPETNQMFQQGLSDTIKGLRIIMGGTDDERSWSDPMVLASGGKGARLHRAEGNWPNAERYVVCKNFFVDQRANLEARYGQLAFAIVEKTGCGHLPHAIMVVLMQLASATRGRIITMDDEDDHDTAHAAMASVILGTNSNQNDLFVNPAILRMSPEVLWKVAFFAAFQPGAFIGSRQQLRVNPSQPHVLLNEVVTTEDRSNAAFFVENVRSRRVIEAAALTARDALNNVFRSLDALLRANTTERAYSKIRPSLEPRFMALFSDRPAWTAKGLDIERKNVDMDKWFEEVISDQRLALPTHLVERILLGELVVSGRQEMFETRRVVAAFMSVERARRFKSMEDAELMWICKTSFNGAYCDPTSVRNMEASGLVPSVGGAGFSSVKRIPPSLNHDDQCSTSHLRQLGVPVYLAPFHCAHAKNVDMLNRLSMDMNACVHAVQVALTAIDETPAAARVAASLAPLSGVSEDGRAILKSPTVWDGDSVASNVESYFNAEGHDADEFFILMLNHEVFETTACNRAGRDPLSAEERAALRDSQWKLCVAVGKLAIAMAVFFFQLRSHLDGLPYLFTRKHLTNYYLDAWNLFPKSAKSWRKSVLLKHVVVSIIHATVSRLLYHRVGLVAPPEPVLRHNTTTDALKLARVIDDNDNLAMLGDHSMPDIPSEVEKAALRRVDAVLHTRGDDSADGTADAAPGSARKRKGAPSTDPISVPSSPEAPRVTSARGERSDTIAKWLDEDNNTRLHCIGSQRAAAAWDTQIPEDPKAEIVVDDGTSEDDPVVVDLARRAIGCIGVPADTNKSQMKQREVMSLASLILVLRPDALQDVYFHAELSAFYARALVDRNADGTIKADVAAARPRRPRNKRLRDIALHEFYEPVVARMQARARIADLVAEELGSIMMYRMLWCTRDECVARADAARTDIISTAVTSDEILRARAYGLGKVALAVQQGLACYADSIAADLPAAAKMPARAPSDVTMRESNYIEIVMGHKPLPTDGTRAALVGARDRSQCEPDGTDVNDPRDALLNAHGGARGGVMFGDQSHTMHPAAENDEIDELMRRDDARVLADEAAAAELDAAFDIERAAVMREEETARLEDEQRPMDVDADADAAAGTEAHPRIRRQIKVLLLDDDEAGDSLPHEDEDATGADAIAMDGEAERRARPARRSVVQPDCESEGEAAVATTDEDDSRESPEKRHRQLDPCDTRSGGPTVTLLGVTMAGMSPSRSVAHRERRRSALSSAVPVRAGDRASTGLLVVDERARGAGGTGTAADADDDAARRATRAAIQEIRANLMTTADGQDLLVDAAF